MQGRTRRTLGAVGAALLNIDIPLLVKTLEGGINNDIIKRIPFRTHLYATATTMTRSEFVAFQTPRGSEPARRDLRVRRRPRSSDRVGWGRAGVGRSVSGRRSKRPDCCAWMGRLRRCAEQQHVVSLMATLASGILFGPGGQDIRSTRDLPGFFEQLRTLYGHQPGLQGGWDWLIPSQHEDGPALAYSFLPRV